MATVPGIDVSYWNAGIDWPKVRATGQRFMFTKATEGDFYADQTFDDNWIGAKKAGLLRGAYHFFRANVDAKKQATKFIDYVKTMNDNGELPPVLDLETHDGQSKARIISRAKTWLDEVEKAFGKKPIIYSGQYFLQDYFSEAGGGPPSWAKDYPLWLAQYPFNYVDGSSKPFLPRGWFKWTFWQYSDKGRINGINANVDLNVFNGTLEDLYKLAGAKIDTDTPQTPKKHTVVAGDSFESIANKYGVTVRELVNANPQLLKTGDSLTVPIAVAIPTEGGTTTPPKPQIKHTVRPGETLYGIAIKYGTTIAKIADANNITNVNLIEVGQVLVIPS
jgi:lysozyme